MAAHLNSALGCASGFAMKKHARVLPLIALTAIAFAQPFRPVVVVGRSMAPTFHSYEVLFGRRPDQEIQRGEVVVVRRDGETMVKRVAFLGGDTLLQYRLNEEWRIPMIGKEMDMIRRFHYPTRRFLIPSGELYLIGDNFGQSVDSREYGSVPVEDVVAIIPSAEREPIWKEFLGSRLAHPPLVASR